MAFLKGKRKTIKHGQSINLGAFRIEFIKTNHSIQDAPPWRFIHLPEPLCIPVTLKWTIRRYSGMPLICRGLLRSAKRCTGPDVRQYQCRAQRLYHVRAHRGKKRLTICFADHKNTRIIIATFASNVDRVQQIINSAYKYGRKVVVEGRSMVNVIGTAAELGYLNVPENTLIDIEQMKNTRMSRWY